MIVAKICKIKIGFTKLSCKTAVIQYTLFDHITGSNYKARFEYLTINSYT